MNRQDVQYSVSELAQMAGVSVRTLHYYDQIGLLRPRGYSPSGYRQYQRVDLERLQVILFYKELELPLKDIRGLLGAPRFDPRSALQEQRKRLVERRDRLDRLIGTLDRTLNQKGEHMLTDEELYEGFAPEEREEIRREVQERWDPKMESEARVRKLSKNQFEAVKQRGDEITRRAAALDAEFEGKSTEAALKDPRTKQLMADWHAHIGGFYECSGEMFHNLGQMYVEDPRFTKTYDKYRKGLAVFMRDAMAWYAKEFLGYSPKA